MENSHSTSYKKDLDKSEVMVGSKYADKKEFDLWANDYDKTVGISDEKNTYPFAGYKKVLGFIFQTIMKTENAIFGYWVRDRYINNKAI